MAMFLNLPKVPLPGPKTMPVIGNKAAVLRFLGDPVEGMLSLHETYGNLVAMSRDDPGWLSVAGGELTHAVLSRADLYPNFIESPIRMPEGSAADTIKNNILGQNGESHRQTRRQLMSGFTKERLRSYGEKIVNYATHHIEAWTIPGSFGPHAQMQSISLEIAMGCLYGLSLEESHELCKASARLMDLVLSPVVALLPLRIPGTPYADFMTSCEQVVDGFQTLIARRRSEGLGEDVLSALITAEDEQGNKMTDRELVGQASTLFNASHDTTAMTLTWACLMLATHVDVQDAVANEVETVLDGAPPSLADLERMPLLGRVVDETLRLFPATPNLFFRRSSAPTTLGGHELPAGATLVISPLVTHRDPKLFPDPKRFRPGRWEQLRVGPYEYIPFGAGVRRCLGAGFAAQSTRLVLASVLQRARLAAPRAQTIDYKAKGVVLGLQGEIDLELLAPGETLPEPGAIDGTILRLVEFGG